MRLLRVFFLSLFLLLTVSEPSVAQPLLKCTAYKSGVAMEHSRVASYVQDSTGLLWLGTWVGLCRYDGKDFHFFRNTASADAENRQMPLGSNRILRMELDSRENLWCINYDYGLYRFDRRTSTFLSVLPLVKDLSSRQVLREKVFVARQNHAVWASLNDGTLIRFDDADPSVHEVLPCPSDSPNRQLYEVRVDSQGREWILSSNGVQIYGQGVVTRTPYSRFIETEGHCLLACTNCSRLSEYMPDGSLRNIELSAGIQRIFYIYALGNGLVGLSTDIGLALYDPRNDAVRMVSKTDKGTPLHNVSRFYLDSRNRIWFYASESGIYCLEPGAESARFLPSPGPSSDGSVVNGKIHLFTEDPYGGIWVKPSDGELCWVDESTMRLRDYRECLSDPMPSNIRDYSFYFVDQQKNLWISSKNQVYQFSFGRRQFHPIFNQSNCDVRSLMAEDADHIWIADMAGRVCRYQMSTGRYQYLSPQGQWSDRPVVFDSSVIYTFCRDHRNRIWMGSRGAGLFGLTPSGSGYLVSHYQQGKGAYDLNCQDIYDVYEDERQHLWVATFGGGINLLEEWSDGSVRFHHAGNDMAHFPIQTFESVRTLVGDGHGRMLAGTNNGLLAFSSDFDRIENLQFYSYQAQTPMEAPLQDNLVMQVLCDVNGTFYVSTYGRGLSRVNGTDLETLGFTPLPNRDFPAGDANISALILSSGEIWTVAECGITCYSSKVDRMWYFDDRDFDRSYSFSECNPIELPDGRVVMGMVGGLITFQSDDLHKSLFAPKIIFTERKYAEGSEEHQQELNDIDSLIVEPHQRSTSLHFAALDYVPSRLIRYAYWMHPEGEGQNPQWVYTETPEVNFTNLAPGVYQLHLRSTNNEGIWRNNFRVLTIIVVPTFWEHWGWLINIIIVVILSGLSLAWYLRRLRQRQQHVVRQEVAAAKFEMLTRPAEQNDQEFVKRLLALLERNLSDGELQVNDLADQMNMSRATFYRRLKQSVDMSPNDFIHQVRMRRSMELLGTTDDTVAQIAYAVGFNNPKYFSKCFRQDFGLTPAEYRKRQQKSTGESSVAEGADE